MFLSNSNSNNAKSFSSLPSLSSQQNEIFPGLKLKNGANVAQLVPEIVQTFASIVDIFKQHGAPSPVITSGNDSDKHKTNSKHYKNAAIDLRGNNVSEEKLKKMAKDLQTTLGDGYFVQAEIFKDNPLNNHIHVQYQLANSSSASMVAQHQHPIAHHHHTTETHHRHAAQHTQARHAHRTHHHTRHHTHSAQKPHTAAQHALALPQDSRPLLRRSCIL